MDKEKDILPLQQDIQDDDPEMSAIIKKEKQRQLKTLSLIASSNFTSKSVLQVLGSCLTNIVSEGLPGQRYYGGTEYIDEIEILCQKRALETFKLDSSEWGVNVQPLSGTPANFAVYTALVGPHGRIMGLDLPDGGHLSHGFATPTKKISATSIYFESLPYKVNPVTGLIDYDELQKTAKLFLPKLIVAGVSCYSRNLNYARFRQIADDNGAYLLGDMAHISGLVAAGLVSNPFELCDVVTTTTYKTLRGPRSGLLFYRKGIRRVLRDGRKEMYDLEKKINDAVFPGLQGAPHNHQIGAVAVALKQAMTPEFKKYQEQVITNARLISTELQAKGYTVVTGGTDTHIVLVDLRPNGMDGARAEKLLENVGIVLNKNTCPGDKNALHPSGIRIGSSALTSRGMNEKQFEQVSEFIHQGLMITKEVIGTCGPTFRDFLDKLKNDDGIKQKMTDLKSSVETFALQFPMPGIDGW